MGVPGSSPLARGLPGEEAAVEALVGIIPARAGFTSARRRRASSPADHPRSRGVYSRRIAWAASHRDHPRSRGVYPPRRNPITVTQGSSPLARGLPQKTHRTVGQPRIIPARAGFTHQFVFVIGFSQDHPRSRGVYPRPPQTQITRVRIIPARAGFTSTTSPTRTCASGSSPLARGLPPRSDPAPAQPRIIPARAGFTRTP